MISPDFSPGSALVGGAMIGVAASMLLLLTGRISGISGIASGLLSAHRGDVAWRVAFLAGLVAAGVLLLAVDPTLVQESVARSVGVTAVAGVIVGVGVRLGSGCTSGHGVCGLSRFSTRSLAATLTFLGTGAITASVIQLAGGQL